MGQHNKVMFLLGMLCTWEIQEHYQDNQFKKYPDLTGLMVRRMMVHSGKNYQKHN